MAQYVIVGNSAGGVGAIEAIRQLDRSGAITVISEEPDVIYSRPMISKLVAGETTLEEMRYRPASFYRDHGVEVISQTRAVRLSPAERTLELADGRTVTWESLLLATGGTPFVPAIEGLPRDGVFTFTTLADAEGLLTRVAEARRAVVIGGGLIGVSVAEALSKRGLAVTIVELKHRILNMILDDEASLLAEEAVRRAGVEVITGHTVATVVGHPSDGGAVASVFLDDGREVPCDLLIVAIGVVPRVELARAAGLQVNRGIVVDRRLATSAEGIYACGDAAEAYDFALGAARPTPVWPNAYLGGRVAGRNMAGVATEYAGGTASNSLNYFGLSIASAGLVAAPSDDGYRVLTRREPGTGLYRKLILKDTKLVGLIYVGDIERSGIAFGLMREGADVSGYADQLLADDLGLISLPHEMRQARLEGRLNGSYA